ncbi:hypothetical protein [Actinoplanes subglobosus]|uniref:Integral membrane protein n=1 Tax=Actinoplanes subglobosus TaxID=1547892 RepID=A0ABV8IWU0_9ACTN
MSAEQWPSIPAVLRVMSGWFLVGIGLLNLAVEFDGGLTGAYLIFHLVITAGGVLLLLRRRPRPSRGGWVAAAVLIVVVFVATLAPDTSACCMENYPGRHGYPFPFLGAGGGLHVDPLYLGADLIFWGCASLLAVVALALTERALPERRVPVDLSLYDAVAGPPARSENVGGLT